VFTVCVSVEFDKIHHQHCECIVIVYLVYSRCQFKAVVEEADPRKDVEAKPGSRHGHYETSHVAKVPHCLGPHQTQQYVVVLLTLIFIHRCHLHIRTLCYYDSLIPSEHNIFKSTFFIETFLAHRFQYLTL
jgi:hypothetical protein